jgi:hypothetical protein
MDSRKSQSGRLEREVARQASSSMPDAELDSGAKPTSPTIVPLDRYSDPLAAFAAEKGEQSTAPAGRVYERQMPPPAPDEVARTRPDQEVAVSPRHEAPQVAPSPVAYRDLPLMSPVSPDYRAQFSGPPRRRRPWIALGLVAAAFAAFAAGGYWYESASGFRVTSSQPARASDVSASHTDRSPAAQATDGGVVPEREEQSAAASRAEGIPSEQPTDVAALPKNVPHPQAAATSRETQASAPGADAKNEQRADAPAERHAAAGPDVAVSKDAESDSRRGTIARPPLSEADSLSGEWSMNTRVESSRLQRYEGLRLVYQLRLHQVGNQLTGAGYKIRENDHAIQTQTPITLSGEVQGDRVVMTFMERGTQRASTGKLVLDRESNDVLRGRFLSDAAQSAGVVEAHR